jgi:hypothetical protein
MKIDLDHLHYWIQAIRQSDDPVRTMDAFWSGQLKSKEWLIDNLKPYIKTWVTIDIHGGWVGVLASMLFQSGLPITNIRSIDIDPTCESIAIMMNKAEEISGRFRAVTSDMLLTHIDADIVINTSCEHITQAQYDLWLSRIPRDSLIVLQSNNYDIPEHVRIASSLSEFKDQSNLEILFSAEREFQLYTRYMIIGKVR